MTRQQFMDFFRSDEFHVHMTNDDCIEIFMSVLKGSSDISEELIAELKQSYGIEASE